MIISVMKQRHTQMGGKTIKWNTLEGLLTCFLHGLYTVY